VNMRIILAVNRVEFLTIRISYIIRDMWCDITVLKVHIQQRIKLML
jgi:hypothetical protein